MDAPSGCDGNRRAAALEQHGAIVLFLRGGVVPEYNRIAQKVMAEMNVAFNDRYSAVNSDLRRFQNRCDIHYNPEGYNFLAENDWDVFARLLRLKH